MPWVRIDEEFVQHPKVVQVGPLGVALQVAALCYCNHNLTDGFLPSGAVRMLLDFSGLSEDVGEQDEEWLVVHAFLIADRLVEAGMWERVEGGYRIHDFGVYQPSRAQVLAEREKTRYRVAKHRASKRNAVGNAVTNGVSNGPVTPSPVPVPEPQNQKVNTVVAQARPDVSEIQQVFDAWKATLPPGSRHELTDMRREAIRAALKRYPLQDVLDAVRGWQNDPWEERSQQNDIGQLLWMGTRRKPSNVLEKMRDLWRNGPPTQAMTGRAAQHRQQVVQTHNALDSWAKEVDARANGSGGVAVDRDEAQRQLPRPGDRS